MVLSQLGWVGLAVGSAVLWGLQYALWGQLVVAMAPAAALFWYVVFSLVLYGVLMTVLGVDVELHRLADWRVVAILVVVTALGALANLGMMTGFRLKSAAAVTMIQVSYPVFTALFGWILFRNVSLSWTMLLGFACVVVGIGLVVVGQE